MSYDLFSDAAKDTALDAIGGTIMGSVETELLKQVFVAVGNGGGGAGQFVPVDPNDSSQMDATYLPDEIDARVSVLTGTDAALETELLGLGEIAAPTDKSYLRRGNGVDNGGRIVAGGLVFAQTYNVGTIESGNAFTGVELPPGVYEVSLQLTCQNGSGYNDISIILQGTEAFAIKGFCDTITQEPSSGSILFSLSSVFQLDILGAGSGSVQGVVRGLINVTTATELSGVISCSDNSITLTTVAIAITARA